MVAMADSWGGKLVDDATIVERAQEVGVIATALKGRPELIDREAGETARGRMAARLAFAAWRAPLEWLEE